MIRQEKYQRCLVLAGGGFRFGYHLGMYAAAVDAGRAPDLLLATCGGAISAAVIQALPDHAARKAWIASPQMYDFLRGLQSTPLATPWRALSQAVGRGLRGGAVPRRPDLFNDYLFEIPAQLPLPPPRAAGESGIALAIVGGKLLYGADDAGQPRHGGKLYAETVFCDARSAALLDGMRSPIGDGGWADTVAPELLIDSTMSVGDAVRISISDMYYFRCHTVPQADYTGGVLDLYPVELAQRLARHVTMEIKPLFDRWMSAPALRAVFGIDANRRLRHVHAQAADVWIDTADIGMALRGNGMQKKIAWRENRIRLVGVPDHASYVAEVDAQWRYGYQRAQQAYAREAQSGLLRAAVSGA
ncbi:MAG: patatin-like phospholipase family protein [Pseudomonadota bacterium]